MDLDDLLEEFKDDNPKQSSDNNGWGSPDKY